MSLNAFRIEKISEKVSLNLNNEGIIDYLEQTETVFYAGQDYLGYMSVPVKSLRHIIDCASAFELSDFEIKQLEQDIKGLEIGDYIEYACY